MKQMQAFLALALLLFAGLNCGTENPIEEVADTSVVEASTGMPRGEVQSIDEVPDKLDPGQGLSLGSQAPAFELPDGDGTLHALADYVGNKNVVLIFYRGGW